MWGIQGNFALNSNKSIVEHLDVLQFWYLLSGIHDSLSTEYK